MIASLLGVSCGCGCSLLIDTWYVPGTTLGVESGDESAFGHSVKKIRSIDGLLLGSKR